MSGSCGSREGLRLIFITLEFAASTFSGNGVYSQSQVRSLTELGHQVFVISGKPFGERKDQPTDVGPAALMEFPLPTWNRLDKGSSWAEFASSVDAPLAELVRDFSPHFVLGVDWTSVGVYKALAALIPSLPGFIFLNYRVYSLSNYYSHTQEEDADKEFYLEKEREALKAAVEVVALSRTDMEFLTQECLLLGLNLQVKILLPPLRQDVLMLSQNTSPKPNRQFLSCCVRLSPEKNAMFFVDLLESLGCEFLESAGVVPVLCGGGRGDYADTVRARVRSACRHAIVHEEFLSPAQLGEVFSNTILNVHPPTYDAFGMTIVESASFGAPSLIHSGLQGGVGARDLLLGGGDAGAPQRQYFGLDLAAPPTIVAESVRSILLDVQELRRVGQAAQSRAITWTERQNGEDLVQILRSIKVATNSTSCGL